MLPLLAALAFAGCGGDSPFSKEIERENVRVKGDLVAAYRVANRARLEGLRCSTGFGPCTHPSWYAEDGLVQAEVGSKLLKRLSMTIARSSDGVTDPRGTYLVSGKTGRKSITLAQRTRYGTVWVLHGSPAGYRITRLTDAD